MNRQGTYGQAKNIRLLALDLDGTLLKNDKSLSETDRAALLRAIGQGILVVPTTGRTRTAIPQAVRELPGMRYAICSNGASVLNLISGEILFQRDLELPLVLSILDAMAEYDIILDLFADGKVITEKQNLTRLDEFGLPETVKELVFSTRHAVDCLREYVLHEAVHIERFNLFYHTAAQRDELRRRLMEIPGIHLASSIFKNLEINREGADKGTALMWLIRRLGIEREQTAAIGDSDNDSTMIREAGLGIAMGNAIEEIKRIADQVTKTNEEDGVAWAIETILKMD